MPVRSLPYVRVDLGFDERLVFHRVLDLIVEHGREHKDGHKCHNEEHEEVGALLAESEGIRNRRIHDHLHGRSSVHHVNEHEDIGGQLQSLGHGALQQEEKVVLVVVEAHTRA